jgi:hypothetical protein
MEKKGNLAKGLNLGPFGLKGRGDYNHYIIYFLEIYIVQNI